VDHGSDDARLAAVTIGERKPHDGPIVLASYDPKWPALFEILSARVRAALSAQILLLEHVGSTSVSGLCAKPFIDMVLAVANSSDESAYVPRLVEHGFVLRIREPDWFEHRLLNATEPVGKLHVFSAGCPEIGRMIAFRDHLRTHERDRALYASTKTMLAARTWKHVQNYADAKTEVVRDILSRA
jgi:GrpB-like predicted nucleotidyltransferase (UPF0157 family)